MTRRSAADVGTAIRAQRAVVTELDQALWAGGYDESRLASYQAAFRELERLIGSCDTDPRHHFVIVIPVADSPGHLRNCLGSLHELCRAFGYGGMRDGRWCKVSVLLADDSGDAANIERHRGIAYELHGLGLPTEYFGLSEQLALLDRLAGLDLTACIGAHSRDAFHHKGQAMMRNITWLRCAQLAAARPHERLLFYTVDADQVFRVNAATPEGDREVCALNFLFHLDEIFNRGDVLALTGKVVGDPPVSPAVMAGNFLEDVIAFLEEMAAAEPHRPYPQPCLASGGDAAYHDMAELFGFKQTQAVYRYRCRLPGAPDYAGCFAEFAGHLNRFFHGQHPTRVTWYEHADALASVQPARTVYTGNYAFRPEALFWLIPFAPLRLRMSGPTMGRMLKAAIGKRFVSANLPMLHRRTLETTGRAEYRPGVHDRARNIELCDEIERQFHGDVMLFSMERLTALGYPQEHLFEPVVAEILATMQTQMREKYRARRGILMERLDQLRALLEEPGRWWHLSPELAASVADFRTFANNIERNFGRGSPCSQRLEAGQAADHWRVRQGASILGFHEQRRLWGQALGRLGLGQG